MKRAAVVAAVLVVLLAVGAVGWLVRPDGQPKSRHEAGTAGAGRVTAAVSASPTPTPSAPASCASVEHAFDPRQIVVPGVTRGATVVDPPREAGGVPGTPPLTSDGKREFAWDRAQGIRPGDPAGNVLLNAHTWPDGSALGNHLLAGLQRGDRIVVLGRDVRLCYRVTERVEVSATRGLASYYATDGPPQLAIVVCSGRRTGPGEWTKRTVWFASPSA